MFLLSKQKGFYDNRVQIILVIVRMLEYNILQRLLEWMCSKWNFCRPKKQPKNGIYQDVEFSYFVAKEEYKEHLSSAMFGLYQKMQKSQRTEERLGKNLRMAREIN